MKTLIFPTGNEVKFRLANLVCKQKGIALQRLEIDVPELQAENGEEVCRDKALRAFEILRKPLVVNDDSWIIPGLGGFPGPYMKSMNKWFTSEDWLRLTKDLTDRRIILRQVAVYQDQNQQKTFISDIQGVLLTEIRGESHFTHTPMVSFDGGKNTVAEVHARGEAAAEGHRTAWHDFAEWFAAQS